MYAECFRGYLGHLESAQQLLLKCKYAVHRGGSIDFQGGPPVSGPGCHRTSVHV